MYGLCFILISFNIVSGLQVKFITWNVNDNHRFKSYNKDIVSELLAFNSSKIKSLPDIYAISFQENCLHCNHGNLKYIGTPFIETLESVKLAKYKLVSISDTRNARFCESLYCVPFASLHGTTVLMLLIKETFTVKDMFKEKETRCSSTSNKEKGIAMVGFTIENTKYCFGGLHFDDESLQQRHECVSKWFIKVKGKCDVTFLGGDFNTRPTPKNTPKPWSYEGGHEKELFEAMRITDDLSGSNPYSGGVNLLTYISQKTGVKYIEPFNKPPNFVPTYSIDSSLKCKFSPVCYNSKRHPGWTDRIIFAPGDKVECTDYNVIESLAKFSDHLPVSVDCQITI